MHSIFDEFYSTLNLQDLLDDDSITFTLKEPNQQLIDVLSKNQNLVKEMLDYLHYDEFDTDYRLNIKYPFVVSEILSTQYVLEKETIQYLLDQLDSTNIKPAITIGYVGKILLNVLKNQPEIFWEIVTIREIQYLLQDVNNYSIAEVIYSMIIFQTNNNQLAFIEKRLELLNYLIDNFATEISEGISNILELLLQQISDTIQEQKLYFIKHLFSKIPLFTNQLFNKPQEVTKILILYLNNAHINDDDKLSIYRNINYEQIQIYLQSESAIFGQNRMSLILLLEYLSSKEQFQQTINITNLMNMQLGLIQKYPNHNQLHLHSTNIILIFIPFFSEEFKNQFELLCTQFIEDPKPNRGFIINILQRMNRTNNPTVQSLIKVNTSYILDVVPDKQTPFHLEEEFEAAMEKLKIQQE